MNLWLWLALLIAILLRIEHRFHFRKWTADTAVQLAIVRDDSSREAEGFYLKLYNPEDLATPILAKETGFMHGYSWLLSALPYRGKALIGASFLLDSLAIIALSLCTFLLLNIMGPSAKTKGLFLIFWGLALPILHYLPSVDLFSLMLFFLGCFISLLTWHKGGMNYVSATICFGLAAFMRNAFLPFLMLPVMLAVWHMWEERKISPRHAMAVLPVILALFPLLSMNKVGGYHFGVMDGELYFSHWLRIDAFPFKSLFYFGTPHEAKLAAYSPLFPILLKGIGAIISLGLIWAVTQSLQAKWVLKKNKQKVIPLWHLSLLCWLVMAINVSMLLFFSLTSPPENWNASGFWTFVMETRYFAPTMLLLLILFFLLAFDREKWKGQRLLRMLIVAAVTINAVFGLWLKIDVNVLGNKEKTFASGPIPALMAELEKESSTGESEVLICSEQNIRAGEILNTAFLPIDWLSEQDTLYTSKAVQLWLIANENPSEMEGRLLEKWPFTRKTKLGESGLILFEMEGLSQKPHF